MRGGGSGAAHVSCGFVRMDDANAGREKNLRGGQIRSADRKIAMGRDTMSWARVNADPSRREAPQSIPTQDPSVGRSDPAGIHPSMPARAGRPRPTDERASCGGRRRRRRRRRQRRRSCFWAASQPMRHAAASSLLKFTSPAGCQRCLVSFKIRQDDWVSRATRLAMLHRTNLSPLFERPSFVLTPWPIGARRRRAERRPTHGPAGHPAAEVGGHFARGKRPRRVDNGSGRVICFSCCTSRAGR